MQCTRTEFFGRKSTIHGRMHYECEFNDWLFAKKNCAYLENVIECLPIRKMCCGDMVEVFQTTPTRKICHPMDILLISKFIEVKQRGILMITSV
jgi:hypothetical protein